MARRTEQRTGVFSRPSLLALPALAAFLLPGFLASAAQEQNPKPENVGDDMCLVCHDTYVSVKLTPHAAVSCEDCHSAGSLHVAAGGGEERPLSFKDREFGWVNGQCLSCHRQDEHMTGFSKSLHARSELSCATCHQMHPEQPKSGMLVSSEQELCADCHAPVAAEFRMPFRHPVEEGAMRCSDCHAPHAAELPGQRRMAVSHEESCVKCHADKKGPFVFQHAALEAADCQSCHLPHGSVNAKMLTRSRVDQLCLECHSMSIGTAGSQPFAFHDLRSPRFRNCTTCHREIHGSNVSPAFLR